jgi:hypothetical protein
MAFEDVKDKFRDSFQTIAGHVQESDLYIRLVEKFQDRSPRSQKMILAGGSAIGVLVMLLIPWLFFSSSMDQMDTMEANKSLMRELFRVSRVASTLPPLPPTVTQADLRNFIQSELNMINPPVKDQIGPMTDFDDTGKTAGTPFSKELEQRGVAVTLNKLNLQQVVDIGGRLQRIRPTTKMLGIEVKATDKDPHYFDVTYRIAAISLPPETAAGGPGKPGAKPPGKK